MEPQPKRLFTGILRTVHMKNFFCRKIALMESITLRRCFSTHHPPPSVRPHLFCRTGHEKRRGEQLKWSLAFRLYIRSFVFHVHSCQDQFIQPGWAECFIFSLGLYFVCLCCFNLFVCLTVPILLCFPEQLSHLPYRFWRWRN